MAGITVQDFDLSKPLQVSSHLMSSNRVDAWLSDDILPSQWLKGHTVYEGYNPRRFGA
jgi:hypothetical protein